MKATKNMNGAARVAVQAKLDAVEKELRCARLHSQQYQAELGRVRELVGRYEGESRDLATQLDLANRQLKWVGESCRKHLDTIQGLEAKQADHDEFVEKLELELDIAEEEIQRHKEAADHWCSWFWVMTASHVLYAAAEIAGFL